MNLLLVKDYLKFNNIQTSLFLSCNNATEKIKENYEFQSDDIWMNFWDISNESNVVGLNYKKILMRLGSPLSVVINLECDESMAVMKEISDRKMFHYERYWLMFCNDWDQAYELLHSQYINMDAEIYLALPFNET